MSISSTPASVNHLSGGQLPLFPDDAPLQVTYWRKVSNAFAQYYRDAGLTHAQACMVNTIRSYAHRGQLPAPALSAVALTMRTDVRQVQRWLKALEVAGLVIVQERNSLHGQRLANGYDFTPLFRRCEELDTAARAERQATRKASSEATEEAAPAEIAAAAPPVINTTPPPVINTTPYEKVLTYLEIGNDVSVPPTPVAHAREPLADEEQPPDARPQDRLAADYQALVEPLTAIGEELGDKAHPLATTTRAYKLMTAARLDVGLFLDLVEEARLHTLAAIQARRWGKPPKPVTNPMAYYFGVLARLTQPDKYRPQWRTGPPKARPDAAPAPSRASSPPSNVWEAVTAEAVQIMTPENVARWFTSAHQVEHVGDVLTIAVSDDFHRQWLDGRLRRSVDRCAASVQPGLQVRFIVEPSTPPLDPAL